jgi:hypothetical protein
MILLMVCFNGMNITYKSEDATHDDLRYWANRRAKQGYEITWLSPNEVEINSDGLVDDNMGWLILTSPR